MIKYRHYFDFGIFILFKKLDDKTALFYKEDDLHKNNIIKPEERLIKYKLSEMILIF